MDKQSQCYFKVFERRLRISQNTRSNFTEVKKKIHLSKFCSRAHAKAVYNFATYLCLSLLCYFCSLKLQYSSVSYDVFRRRGGRFPRVVVILGFSA